MIKFFRKIRQKLLSENKFSNYLLYAMGEIFLVVIGILIALQINNWNDDRKEQKELEVYLLKISNDVQQDLLQLEGFLKKRQLLVQNCQKAVTKFNEGIFDPEVFMEASMAFVDVYYTPNESGYEALKNSSYLGKINGTTIDSLLNDYRATMNLALTQEKSYLSYVENMEVAWTSKHDVFRLLSVRAALKQNHSPEQLDQDLARTMVAAFEDQAYRSVVSRTSIQSNFMYHSKKLMATGQKIINEIEAMSRD